MHKYFSFLFAAALNLLAWLPAHAIAEGVRSPSMLANTCAGCHGTNGYSAGASLPSLAGLNKRYLYKSMRDFQSDVRPSTIMGRIARGYSDQELKTIAAFFADQEWRNAPAKVDKQLVAAGEGVHQTYCETCHLNGGVSGTKDTPRIAGQWPEYTYNLMVDQHTIGRACIQPRLMRTRIQKLSQEELEALSHYYADQE
jgi:sulfide dehydrogenase cytochrome subunit